MEKNELAELEALRAENAALKAATADKHTIKISAKGAVCVYGFGRYPVTLYAEAWEEILGTPLGERILAIITANPDKVSRKDRNAQADTTEA